MGQDRKFSDDELRFALETVQFYKETWEKIENSNLLSDVQWKLRNHQYDKDYKEHFAELDENEITK